MTTFQRIRACFAGLIALCFAIVAMIYPDKGFILIMAGLGISLFLSGVRMVIYYFSMARHMVGGRYMLYLGLIVLDFGMFTLALSDIPRIYIVTYLLGCNVFAGAIEIMRALESKRLNCSWKLNMSRGITDLLIAVTCCVFVSSTRVLVYLYCLGLIYVSCIRIINAFRRTAIVYIQ